MQVEERSKHEHNSSTAKPSTTSKSNITNDRIKEVEINDTRHADWSSSYHDVEHEASKPRRIKINYTLKPHDTLNKKVNTKCREKQMRNKYTDILYNDCRMENLSRDSEKSYYTLQTETKNDGRSLLKTNDGAAVDNGRSLLKCNDEAAMVNMSVDKTGIYFGSMELDKQAAKDNQRHHEKLLEEANSSKSCSNTLSRCIGTMDTHNSYHGNHVNSNHSSQSSGYQGSQSTNVSVFPVQRSTSSMNEAMKSNWVSTL